MKKNKIAIAAFLLVLGLASLACTVFVGGPAYPEQSVPVSTEAALSAEQMMQAAQTAAANNGLLSLTFSESQMTSLLAAKLAEKPDPFLTNPQVYFRDNQVLVFGKAVQGNLEFNVRIVLSVSVSPEGKPAIAVVSTDFGPFPAPEGLNGTISAFLQEIFTGALGPAAISFRLETVTIADGLMTITGRIK